MHVARSSPILNIFQAASIQWWPQLNSVTSIQSAIIHHTQHLTLDRTSGVARESSTWSEKFWRRPENKISSLNLKKPQLVAKKGHLVVLFFPLTYLLKNPDKQKRWSHRCLLCIGNPTNSRPRTLTLTQPYFNPIWRSPSRHPGELPPDRAGANLGQGWG